MNGSVQKDDVGQQRDMRQIHLESWDLQLKREEWSVSVGRNWELMDKPVSLMEQIQLNVFEWVKAMVQVMLLLPPLRVLWMVSVD